MVARMPDPSYLAKLLRSDPMGAQEHQAYLQAIGAPVSPMASPQPTPQTPQMQPTGGPQGVVQIPQNVQGLARLLVQTGRARDLQSALLMAQQMTAR